jgi:hypothetical protein
LLGKTLLSVSTGSANTPVGININPAALGLRPATYSNIYSKWTIRRLIVKIVAVASSASGSCTLGFLDDTTTSTDLPTSTTGVLNLRCSSSFATVGSGLFSAVSTYNEYEWRPIRTRGALEWYFTTLEGSSSDPRLEVPCSLWFASSVANVACTLEVDYDIVYDGAVDTASS